MPPPPSQPAPQPARATGTYATWGSRLLAYIVDTLIVGIPAGIVTIVALGMTASGVDQVTQEVSGAATAGVALTIVASLAAGLFSLWNMGWRQGVRGQSIGKGIMNISVITESGQFMGAGLGVGRALLRFIDAIPCLLGFLWPLWDDRKQTFTDKILNTIVVDA